MVKASELRDLGLDDLERRARDLEDQLFRMRLQARVKTVIREKQG
jgi:ribosomal protein L29